MKGENGLQETTELLAPWVPEGLLVSEDDQVSWSRRCSRQ